MTTIIDGSGVSFSRRIAEFRAYRTLFLFLTLRDITLRYRQTVLGVLWAVLQPIIPMLIFTVIFARALRGETGGVPYSLFALAGLAPWMFFANAINAASTTFIMNHNLLNKVYFPRAILPGAAAVACVLDGMVAGIFLVGLLLFHGYRPHEAWLFIPVIAAITLVLATSVGLAAASLMALYRDMKHAFPFLVQLWMYATPVVYPTKLVPGIFHRLIALNPMSGVVDAVRYCLFGTPLDWMSVALSGLSAILIWIGAAAIFQHLETDLAERV